ncbi:MAG: cytochrome D1 domain-containing protein [Nitrospirota bacterium]
MVTGFLQRFLQKAAVFSAIASMLLVIDVFEVQAAKPPPAPLSCSISPADGSTAAGVPIRFIGDTQGGKGSKSYNWDFSDGSEVPAASTEKSVDVTYSTVGGPFAVLLDVTDKQGATANCSTTVTVTQGGVNTPPVANDDSYTVTKNTTLNISAPGILDNDTDAEGDPLTAALETDVSSGNLALYTDGSFNYTPNTDFTGQDFFTYFADDGTDQSNTSATVTITVEDVTPPSSGEALYLENCRMCHGLEAVGGFAQRDIRTAGPTRIRGAITRRADMNFLGRRTNPLTDAEIQDIADYLDTLPKGQDDIPRNGDLVVGEDQYRKSCTYCHSFGNGVGGMKGPDLYGIGSDYSDAFLGAWIGFPTEMINAGAYQRDGIELPLDPYWMPDLGHSDINAWDIAQFMLEQDDIGPLSVTPPKGLTQAEFDATAQVYFNRCAGCHGLYRTGATGPNIDEVRSAEIGTDGLGAILRYGTPAGMPNFGTSGLLTEAEIENLSAFLQLLPPTAPEWTMTDIQATWNVIVPVDDRPSVEPADPKWKNYTGVILRDAGEVSIIDATTKQEVVRLNTGFAVHILRSSATGRYFYSVGRDGLVTLIDLWTDDNVHNDIPKTVATVKGCIDARSVDGSKHDGTASGGINYKDMFVIEGCYWPPQYVTFDGMTLEPQNLVDLRIPAGPAGTMTDIYGATIVENRVAAIAAAHDKPFWMVALKESGYVAIVDYSIPGHGISQQFATEKFLHDGGFDHTGRYFMVAANASEKMVVVDLGTETIGPSYVTSFWTGAVPHPGRGANWYDPVHGWVNATQHFSEPKIAVYGADPLGRPDIAWTVIQNIILPSSGSLFIKTHPNSPWVLFDMTMSSDPVLQKQICAIDKATLAIDRCFDVATNGKAVHMEFNADGSEVWVSDWANEGGVIILDTATLTVKATIYGADTPSGTFKTPTGKFNVTNTAGDIY